MNSLTLEEITYKEIERNFFEIGCELAKMLMQRYLEQLDKELSEHRNKGELRHKGSRKTSIKSLMGEVVVNRAIYRRAKDDGSVEHIYLLDEALGLDTIGLVSPNLVEKILEHSCEMSYRDVSQAITNFTNQTLSHQGVWNIVQAVGEKQAKAEKHLVKALRDNELSGQKEAAILFEEADGLWLSMQGKAEKKDPEKEKNSRSV